MTSEEAQLGGAEAGSAPRYVLIVDDQRGIALWTEAVLLEIGVDQVAIAASVEDAISQIDQTPFSLAILDYKLGTETGWPVAQRLCADRVPMIVTTDMDGVLLPAACGDAAVLKRPYNLNLLASLVRTSHDLK